MLTEAEIQEIVHQCRSLIKTGQEPTRKSIEDIESRLTVLSREIRQNRGGNGQQSSLTDILIHSKDLIDRPTQVTRGMVVNAMISSKDILNVSRGFPEPVMAIAGRGVQTLRVRSLIPTTTTTSGAVTYMRETSFTNAAAPVLEGSVKPKSDKVFTPITVIPETIAHYFKISKQSYDDLPGLAAQLEANLIYGLDLRLEQQILKGTGTPAELQGLYPIATAMSAAPPVESTLIDTLFSATAQLSAAGYTATGAVLSSADWASMQTLKDTTGQYIQSGNIPLPTIVVSPWMAAGEWLVGDFRQAHLYVREEANVQISAFNEDDFTHNLLTALGEVRIGQAIFQPAAFLKPFGAVAVQAGTEQSRRGR